MSERTSLVSRIAAELRQLLRSEEFPAGSKLPTEAMLADRFGVSRPTVRAALKELDVLGLVHTRHGVGSFVTEATVVHAGLERLDSITDSIREEGKVPGMDYASRLVRPVLPEEARRMQVPGDTAVLELRRTIMADGEVVAYSYDLIPTALLPEGFDPEELSGSLFAFFTTGLGIHPLRGEAEVHAVHSGHIGWGPQAAAHELFVLLDQLHFSQDEELFMYSRTYFIEGRYNFTIRRSGER